MTDSQAHLDVVERALVTATRRSGSAWTWTSPGARWPAAAVHIGTRRSPLHTPEQAADFARAITRRPGFRLVGVMGTRARSRAWATRRPGIRSGPG